MKRLIKTVTLLLLAALMLTTAAGAARAEGTGTNAGTGTDTPLKKNGKPIISADELSPYDVVTFGRYPQTEFGTEKPIEWYVIKTDGNQVRLLSRYCIDSQQYNGYNRAMTFEQSALCQWLNGTFKNAAFSAEEQQMLVNDVTLPDMKEAFALPQKYLAATGTEYAIKVCGYNAAANNWWLSDPPAFYNTLWDGARYYCAKTINNDGDQIRIFPLNYHHKGVRPMIVIRLNGTGSGTGTGSTENIDAPVQKDGKAIASANELKLYDVVTFGRYIQTELGTEKPIEWYVIKIDGDKVRLLSRYCIDSRRYNDSCRTMTFEQSDLCQWLNGDFKDLAFSAEERQMLYNSITLPNSEEVFALPQTYRAATGTEYAIKVRGYNAAANHWWLSDPTLLSYEYWDDNDPSYPRVCAKTINFNGSQIRVFPLNYNRKGVRPMIVIRLAENGTGAAANPGTGTAANPGTGAATNPGTGTAANPGTGTGTLLPDSFLFGGVEVWAGQTAVKVVGKQNALIRITPEEMDMLIRLCPNLTTLTLNYCCMADYSRIGELTKLRNLMISTTTHSLDPGIPLVDIDWMASLKDLRTLYLAYNKIEDIRVLSGLTKLEELNLGWNNISDSDLNYLTGLPLRLLYLYCDSSLRDVSALSNIRSLELLHIGGNKKLTFSGIKKLTKLSNLRELDISYCPVKDFVWLRDFKRLETLRIEHSDYIDFYTYYDLASCDALQTVVISKEDTKTEEALRCMIRDCKSDIEIVYWEDYKK